MTQERIYMTFPTRIPTLLGIFMVVIIVGGLIGASEYYFRTSTVASGSILPANVQFTNISDTMFSVSWTTELETTGAISVSSKAPIARPVIFDDQDSQSLGKYRSHMVTYRSAVPDTEYEVTILTNSKKHLNGTKPYVVRTAPSLDGPSGNLDPAYGTLMTEDGKPVRGAIVSLTLEGGQTLSALTKPSGTWLIPLNLVRTEDLTSYLPITERMTENILARADGLETIAVTDTLNDSPVPDMILGKTHDFRRSYAKTPGAPLALKPMSNPANTPNAVLGVTSTNPANKVALTVPTDGAALPTTLPLIQGTGIPGKTVSITIGITKPIGGAATVGSDGLWSFTPPKALAAGRQSVTITTTDSTNKPVAITHLFEVLKSGTQVLGEATPSATPTVEPTAEPTEEATLEGQPIPTSGNELPTIMLILMGLGLLVGGGVVLVK